MNKNEEKTEEIVESPEEQDAELEAAADLNANPDQKQAVEDLKRQIDDLRFTAHFSKTYNFDGKEYKELSLEKLANLTTLDMEYIDNTMTRMRHPVVNTTDRYNDTVYVKHLAMRATGMPVEFFNQLSLKDMLEVMGVVRLYFLFG